MTRHQFPSSRSLALRCSVGLVFSFVLAATAQAGNTFSVTNLVTSSQSANIAPVTDPNLINPWGVSFTPTSPLWVSDNGTGVSTLYSITNSDQVSIVTSPDFPIRGFETTAKLPGIRQSRRIFAPQMCLDAGEFVGRTSEIYGESLVLLSALRR